MIFYKKKFILPLLLLWLLNVSCALKPTTLKDQKSAEKSSIKISLFSNDEIVQHVICSKIHAYKLFDKINCNPAHSQDSDFILTTDMSMRNVSNDLAKNSITSLKYLSFLILVTTSADVDFKFTLKTKTGLKKMSFASHGRAGVWAIQPLLMGYFGTVLGTLFNKDKLPDRLKRKCELVAIGDSLYNSDDCRIYQRFIVDSVNKIWPKFMNELEIIITNYESETSV